MNHTGWKRSCCCFNVQSIASKSGLLSSTGPGILRFISIFLHLEYQVEPYQPFTWGTVQLQHFIFLYEEYRSCYILIYTWVNMDSFAQLHCLNWKKCIPSTCNIQTICWLDKKLDILTCLRNNHWYLLTFIYKRAKSSVFDLGANQGKHTRTNRANTLDAKITSWK